MVLAASGWAQGPAPLPADPASPVSDEVTLHVENADITQVLTAFSQQTGRSVVIGPEVTGIVNMHLQAVPWRQALDVALLPYGYGYQLFEDTIVVNSLANIQQSASVEPIHTRMFQLKFMDASDVEPIVQAQLSPRGQVNVVTMRGQKGWHFESSSGGRDSRAGSSPGRRERDDTSFDLNRSKRLIVSDIPAVLTRIEALLADIDSMPAQVLIEATFVEMDSNLLKDIGVDWGTGADGATSPEIQSQAHIQGNELLGFGAKQGGSGVGPANFNGLSPGLAEVSPFNAGMSLLFSRLNDTQFQVLLHMLAEDASANVLSAPRIMTLNNQEAAIVVGTKFPIISSDTSGESATVSTTLEYYENIGIQLNVVPQICDDEFINMIVHPAVTDQIGTAAARTGGLGNIPLTEYPILSTREADTQIIVKSGQRVAIGGLLEDRESRTELKVPMLGDIPVLGRLFRRETDALAKTDLVIILSATIVDANDMMSDQSRALPAARPLVLPQGVRKTATHVVRVRAAPAPVTPLVHSLPAPALRDAAPWRRVEAEPENVPLHDAGASLDEEAQVPLAEDPLTPTLASDADHLADLSAGVVPGGF